LSDKAMRDIRLAIAHHFYLLAEGQIERLERARRPRYKLINSC
jgi:hypothetical protein